MLSGDADVRDRLFVNKLIAGIWSLSEVQEQLFAMPRGGAAQQALHHRFMDAWNFLAVQTAWHCGRYCRAPLALGWRAPLVGLDLDGVLDQRTFGFPATSAAGIEALSVLHDRGLSVALNTARSAAEVREYCRAYALAGGIAEHGAYLWDAVRERDRVLINPEAARELDALRNRLREIPGVFLDDRHQYSVRAFMYQERPRSLLGSLMRSLRAAEIGDGALAPLPTLLVQQVIADLGLERISFHHTSIDTTFVDANADKGTGLWALRDWVLDERAETIAIGDNTADLPAFRAATRSFAPANVNCAREASLLGCQIVAQRYQRGLLQIARAIADAGSRPRTIPQPPRGADLFLDLLRIADRHWAANLTTMLLDAPAFKVFLR
jgi:hydroxymethylpyrimidine pyrophosphatase-like HAD family hydrolase